MRLKKYRKVLAAGLAAVMTMGMLTGCGGGGGNNAGNGGGGQSASSGSQGSSSSEDAGSGEIVPCLRIFQIHTAQRMILLVRSHAVMVLCL